MLRVVLDSMHKDMRDRVIDSFRRGTFIECPSEECIWDCPVESMTTAAERAQISKTCHIADNLLKDSVGKSSNPHIVTSVMGECYRVLVGGLKEM